LKLLYTNENRLIVSNVQNIVENAGIKVMLKNEYAAGGVGELAVYDTWLEIWVSSDEDFDRASSLLEGAISAPNSEPWVCSTCKEPNDPSFEVCWKCQSEKP